MDFYDDVLRELVLALGAALFLANAFALARRRRDRRLAVERTVARARPGSPVRGYRRDDDVHDLPQAPLGRTILYLVIGFVVMISALASILTK